MDVQDSLSDADTGRDDSDNEEAGHDGVDKWKDEQLCDLIRAISTWESLKQWFADTSRSRLPDRAGAQLDCLAREVGVNRGDENLRRDAHWLKNTFFRLFFEVPGELLSKPWALWPLSNRTRIPCWWAVYFEQIMEGGGRGQSAGDVGAPGLHQEAAPTGSSAFTSGIATPAVPNELELRKAQLEKLLGKARQIEKRLRLLAKCTQRREDKHASVFWSGKLRVSESCRLLRHASS
jgi:hypothetical protein